MGMAAVSTRACLALRDSYFKAFGPKDPFFIRLLGYLDAKSNSQA